MSAPYIVLWTSRNDSSVRAVYRDHYSTFETEAEASELYRRLLEQDSTYTAHIVRPVRSTDYETLRG